MNLPQYFNNSILSCQKCNENKNISSYITFNKLPPYIGENQTNVLILGHSPKVRTLTSISVTLDLNQNNNLSKYINKDILFPLGISIKECIATNIVKCLTTKMPEDLKISGKPFMETVFLFCKYHFIEEINIIKPKLIISLSETVSNLLQKEFGLNGKIERMQEIFATIRSLKIDNLIYPWIPVVHIPTPKVRAHYFPEQSRRLKELSNNINKIIS
jgi:uracil-DNA glycosylase